MKKKTEDKILDEIRNRVIEVDRERKNEQEIKEMQEANIEALTELTSLSKDEVKKIADEVKRDHFDREKEKQRKVILFSVPTIVILIIIYFATRPAAPLKTRTVEDNFNSNAFEWNVLNSFLYDRQIKDGQYTFETKKDDWCYWDGVPITFPQNCDIEVSSKWINGKYNSYGVGLNQSDSAYFSFNLRGDGDASFGKVINGEWIIDNPRKHNKGKDGKMQSNIQKIEIRNKNFKYYVNNNFVESGIIDLDIKELDLRCCGKQKVAFESVKITDTDNQKVIFFDDFTSKTDLWNPKQNITCTSQFENGKYIFDVNNADKCHWSKSESHEITDNCEIELVSTWLKGDLSDYGLMIMNDDDNYYSCELNNMGVARLLECTNNDYSYVQDDVKTGFESDGKNSITQGVVIKGKKLSYYVNGKLIKIMKTNLNFPCNIALRACGKQSVAFEKLKIKYYE